ncbi:MAG TPA: PadR family transcriptional regulator [Bacteroides sp.]|nr:PadR family transcriptional regulator [Bacteroides sp.]
MNDYNLSNAEAALMGLLSEQPMHPYQIEKEVKYRDMRFWTELSMSSIYKLLRKLEKAGLVIKKEEKSPENRLRKLYSLTSEGERKLKAKIGTLLSEPEHTRWNVDIGTYNSNLISEKDVQEAMHEYRLSLREKIIGYRKLKEFLIETGCPPHRLAVSTRPVYLLEAEINWVNSYLKGKFG